MRARDELLEKFADKSFEEQVTFLKAVIEGEKDSQSQAIHLQLASLLSATDKRNPEHAAASKDKQKAEIQTLRNRLQENETMYKLRFQQMVDERTQLELELEQANKSLERL